jgi:hypothetical protein
MDITSPPFMEENYKLYRALQLHYKTPPRSFTYQNILIVGQVQQSIVKFLINF